MKKKIPNVDSKPTIQDVETDISASVNLNTSFPKPLYRRIVAFRKSIGCTSDQEAIRVGITLFLSKNGF